MTYKAIYLILSGLIISGTAQAAEELAFCGQRVQGGLIAVQKDNIYKTGDTYKFRGALFDQHP